MQREIDHLNWASKAGAFQRDESIKQLACGKRPTIACGFAEVVLQ